MDKKLSRELKEVLDLKSSPIAISFTNEAPDAVTLMRGKARLCEMLDKVRLNGKSFYTVSECHDCDGGAGSCGLRLPSEASRTGEFLVKMGLFGSTRAAVRFLHSNPRIEFGTAKVVSFSPLEKATFEPDVVVLVCNAKQGMEMAEAFAYDTGKRVTGLTGPPICSAVVAAPLLSGEITYSLGDAGARHYMQMKDDDILVGIPAELLPQIVANLVSRAVARTNKN